MQSQNNVFTPAARYRREQNIQERSYTDRKLREGGRERKGGPGLRRPFVALDPASLSGTECLRTSSFLWSKEEEEPTEAYYGTLVFLGTCKYSWYMLAMRARSQVDCISLACCISKGLIHSCQFCSCCAGGTPMRTAEKPPGAEDRKRWCCWRPKKHQSSTRAVTF